MDGIELYAKYASLHVSLNNCSVDVWDDLDEDEQAVWEALASELEEKK